MDSAPSVAASAESAVPDGSPDDAADAQPTGHRLRRFARRLGEARFDPYWLAAALFVAYATLSVTRYRRFASMSWDLGIFEQAVRSYAHLQAPIVDLKGPGTNVLGDHFSPVTALLAPFYRVFPSPVTLLVAQAVLFAVSVVPVTRVAARLLGRRRGLAVGVAYGVSWGVQRAVDFDFHEICFAVPLIAFALEALLRERWLAAACWAAPLVLVKEDLGATVAAIGVVLFLRGRRAHEKVTPLALGLIGFGVLASAFALGVVIPEFNTSGSYDYWNKIDAEGGGPAPTIPLETALRTLAWVLVPTTGLLALRSPLLLVALPTLGWRFVSHEEHYWGTDWHYSAVLMPVVFLALVDAVHRSRRSRRGWLRGYADQLPAAAAAAGLALCTALPMAGLTEADTYRKPAWVNEAEQLLDRVPDDATVEANIGPISRLTQRCRVLWIGDTRGVLPDYIALHEPNGRTPDQLVDYARQLHPTARYAHVGSAGGVELLARVGGAGQATA
ncbi:DUF2079 domain-containing protein [Streptomyces sp. 71268]|uniref:DUF2079 domain-containing protein n=1 Tax=Streptomyces sp. 71268 TaxID=3002640 RepID=UPI0023FA0205|nr:DUF2079 domain-containing protein [Streptomyces sp. 71268]WEV27392.1 DUF2079 domain-containing protein [Streptomyces sp. 71268]